MELDNLYSRFPKSCGLSEAEYWSLLLIYEGIVTQSRISEQLFLSRQTLNSAFKQLQKKGLIRLEPYQDNLRSKRAFLTEAGKAFVEERAWQHMSQEDQAVLTALIRKFSSCIRKELDDSNTKG